MKLSQFDLISTPTGTEVTLRNKGNNNLTFQVYGDYDNSRKLQFSSNIPTLICAKLNSLEKSHAIKWLVVRFQYNKDY